MLKIPIQVIWIKANKNVKQEYTTLQDILTNECAPVSFMLLWKNTLKSAVGEKGFIFSHNSRSQSIFVGKSRKKLSEVTKHTQLWTETNTLCMFTSLLFSCPAWSYYPCTIQDFLPMKCFPTPIDLRRKSSIDKSTGKTNWDNSSLTLVKWFQVCKLNVHRL